MLMPIDCAGKVGLPAPSGMSGNSKLVFYTVSRLPRVGWPGIQLGLACRTRSRPALAMVSKGDGHSVADMRKISDVEANR